MTNKKDTIKRLVIFYVLAFVLANVPELLYYFISKDTDFGGYTYSIFGLSAMFAPAIASVLTRLITKEGFSNMLIWGRLKGHIKYYIIAIIFPIAYWAIGEGITSIIYGGFLESDAIELMGVGYFVKYLIYLIGFAMVMILTPFGEELGWRGYMTPKLEEIFNTPITLVLGGCLWGIWHIVDIFFTAQCEISVRFWELVLSKCIVCMGLGAVLTWLTKKTKSVIAASIAHSVFNNTAGIIIIFFTSEAIIKEQGKTVEQMVPVLIPLICVVVVGILISRDKKKEL